MISIVQGPASGGGFALALASDIRLLAPDARMNAGEDFADAVAAFVQKRRRDRQR